MCRAVTIFWYRHPVKPPYAAIFLAGPAMGQGGGPGFHEQDRDLNLVLGGNGKDLSSGFLIRTGPAGSKGSELWKGTERLAAAPAFGLPAGGGVTLHHRWLWLQAIVEEKRIRFYYEGRLALDAALKEPIPPGSLGFWTERGSVQVARITLAE